MSRRAAGLWLMVLGVAVAAPVLAAEPRSAIPWLSESIEIDRTPPPGRPQAPGSAIGPATDPVGGEITVTRLGDVSRDAIGLLAPAETGLPAALWGPVPADDVRQMIADQPDQGVPAARAMFHTLLLAEADPPPGDSEGTGLLVARIDRLLEIGALEEARALIDRAGPDTPDLFRRWFDIGLLLDQAQEPCAALRQNPSLSPTLPARVFCLARGGDWNAAEITLTLGQEVGSIPPAQEALLARFLDPEIFEEAEEPPIPEPLTPLDFLMREAVGLPRPAGPLPLAFLHTELGEHVPMRQRVEAAERLVISGAIDPAILFAAYRSGAPAASGGVWDRAQAVQALDKALAGEAKAGDAGAALLAADAALAQRGLRVALATAMAPLLTDIDPAALAPDARRTLFELLLLAGDPAAAARAAGPEADARATALLAIAEGSQPKPKAEAPQDPMLAGAVAGIAGGPAPDERAARLVALATSGQPGEAVLAALALLGSGPADAPALQAALLALAAAGQADKARVIALQTLLPGPGA